MKEIKRTFKLPQGLSEWLDVYISQKDQDKIATIALRQLFKKSDEGILELLKK